MSDPIYSDKFTINNSEVTIDIIDDISWEDLAVYKANAGMHYRITGVEIFDPTTRAVKDWLIKGE